MSHRPDSAEDLALRTILDAAGRNAVEDVSPGAVRNAPDEGDSLIWAAARLVSQESHGSGDGARTRPETAAEEAPVRERCSDHDSTALTSLLFAD